MPHLRVGIALTTLVIAAAGGAGTVSAQPIPQGVSIETDTGRMQLTVHTELAPNKNGDVRALRQAPVVRELKRYFINMPNWEPLAIRFAVGERVYTDVRPESTLAVMKTSPRGLFVQEVRSGDLKPKWYSRQYRRLAREPGEPAFLILRIVSTLGLNPREYPVRIDRSVLDLPPS